MQKYVTEQPNSEAARQLVAWKTSSSYPVNDRKVLCALLYCLSVSSSV